MKSLETRGSHLDIVITLLLSESQNLIANIWIDKEIIICDEDNNRNKWNIYNLYRQKRNEILYCRGTIQEWQKFLVHFAIAQDFGTYGRRKGLWCLEILARYRFIYLYGEALLNYIDKHNHRNSVIYKNMI